MCPVCYDFRILSDWLEVKLGGHKESEGREEQPEGTLQTLTVTNTLQESGQRTHKVHISIKVRSRGAYRNRNMIIQSRAVLESQ